VNPEQSWIPNIRIARHESHPTRALPLADLVENELNKPLADQVADVLEDRQGEPARSGTDDYARGTPKHEDDQDAE
jgi:hypothetical protein